MATLHFAQLSPDEGPLAPAIQCFTVLVTGNGPIANSATRLLLCLKAYVVGWRIVGSIDAVLTSIPQSLIYILVLILQERDYTGYYLTLTGGF